MQCYSELLPPSGVTQALTLPFTSANASNLIVARTSLLQVFSQKQISQTQDTKLVLVAQYQLSGTVTSIGRVSVPKTKSGGDAVLVAFRDAKLSLVEWDSAEHSISTISIHYYENYVSRSAPWETDIENCINHLTVDPNSRCAAFNFGVSNLAIIPFYGSGDDLAMDDIDELDDEQDESPNKQTNGDTAEHNTPYAPSFVHPITALDPGLLDPVDMAFLHEYRDPTIGILYTIAARSNNLSFERKDVTTYSVFALDLEQKASTSLQAVQNLPNDIHTVVALPLPVGGSLLLGGNELIHIDQGAKATAVGVNEFAREASAFPMADHSSLGLKLEGCRVEQIGTASGDMLLILNTGDLALLSFRLDGRSVSGMTLRRLESGHLKDIVTGRSTCTANLGQGRVFIGSEEADSVLLNTGKKTSQLKRASSKAHLQSNGHGADVDGDDDMDDGSDEDDLYGEAPLQRTQSVTGEALAVNASSVRLMDSFPSIAPLNDSCFGKSLKRKMEDEGEISFEDDPNRLDLAMAMGRGRAGGVVFFSPNLTLTTEKTIGEGRFSDVWSFTTGTKKSQNYAVVSEIDDAGTQTSALWQYHDGDLYRKTDSEFETSKVKTMTVGSLAVSNHTVHVTENQLRVYDSKFGLSQILPIVDEEEGQTAKAVKASFLDPYLVIVKDDATLSLYKADRKGELDELDVPENLSSNILSASLFNDCEDYFQTSRLIKAGHPDTGLLLLLLSKDGVLTLLPLPSPKVQVFRIEGAQYLPSQLRPDAPIPKHWRLQDELADAIIALLGDDVEQQPYLIVRSKSGDLAIYEPYATPEVVGSFKFTKITASNAPCSATLFADDAEEDDRSLPPLSALTNVSGYSSIFIPGKTARLILKHASTPPQVYDIDTNIRSLCLFRQSGPSDLAFVDEQGQICIGSIPSDTIVGVSSWTINRVSLHQDVTAITYFEPTSSYILGTNSVVPFQLPHDDELHPEWRSESTDFLPTTFQSSLRLFSSRTHNIISSHHFDRDERILCIKTMPLETSESAHSIRPLIVVGTAITKGENVATKGNIYLFDVVSVVPHPNKPESDLRLKLLTSEDVRGAVTSITSIGSQGFLLAAQGQKCMVRGLKEDMSILPVAFMDMRYYTHVAKELAGTGLTILGDAFSGLWLVGYSEEPYKMTLLGRDLENPEVVAGDFLPSGKELYIIISDGDGRLRILQYDPENPKSDQGRKLLLRSTFDIADSPTSITLVPRTLTTYEAATAATSADHSSMEVDSPPPSTQQLLTTTQSGAIAIITPLSEATYRRLSTLQNILTTQLTHHCGLNPRAYRKVETDGMGGRGVIDGEIVKRWTMLSSQQKNSLADKVGARGVWELKGDLEGLSGGFGFLA